MALKKKRNENKNFYYEFVDGNFKSKEIRKFKNPVVFTGRGSVLIELAFLGIKSFSFFKSDYLNFKFVNFIQNPEKLSLSDIFFLDNKEILREKKEMLFWQSLYLIKLRQEEYSNLKQYHN